MRALCCRLCGAKLNRSLVDLGMTPLANAYVTPAQADDGVDRPYPLHARVCDTCLLVQVDEVVDPTAIFTDYAYFSSYASSWVDHARRYAGMMMERFGLDSGATVMEVASNDGYLLSHFLAAGVRVLGIEPAVNVAAVARGNGVPTIETFFNAESAMQIAAQYGCADVVVANNVLAHVPDLFGFAAGFTAILRPEGVATFEFPHLLNLIEDVQFDTIYHEHYSYLSLLVVEKVLRSVGLRVFDVERLATHGGSLRVFACHARAGYQAALGLRLVRTLEAEAGLDEPARYDRFAEQVKGVQSRFQAFLQDRKARGHRLAAYGAAAKGNTFLNSCGITQSDITCIADKNPTKQGRLLPGSHIPIVPPDALMQAPPDDLLILPWNIADEIARDMQPLRDAGTRFWVARPDIRAV